MSKPESSNPSILAEILIRVPSALTSEASRDLYESDRNRLDREARVTRTGKLIADLLKNIGVQTVSRSMPAIGVNANDIRIEGWNVLDPDATSIGVFLDQDGAIRRLFRTGYQGIDIVAMHDCKDGSSEALSILESEQFQYGVAGLIARSQQYIEAAGALEGYVVYDDGDETFVPGSGK
jgi:hypothetical protein